MRIAILSDIHDNLWNLETALHAVRDADALICCGDLCSPFVIDQIARFQKEIHIVFGNNDADLYRITDKALKQPHCCIHGELFEQTFDGRRFAVNHFDYIARPLAKSGDYDVVCFGHNHVFEIAQEGSCLLINPGPLMGAKFTRGWEDVAPTFALYDTQGNKAAGFRVDPASRSVTPHNPA